MNRTRHFQKTLFLRAVMRGIAIAFLMACAEPRAGAANEMIPVAPEHHFNDYAHALNEEVAARLDAQLAQFEKDTGGQIVVAIYANMQSDAPVEEYARRVANEWKVGQKGKNNGLVLLIFMHNHTMSLQTGTGYEKIVTDAICLKIIDDEIVPHFKNGDYNGGLAAAVNAMIAATRGEYKPSAPQQQTPAPTPQGPQ